MITIEKTALIAVIISMYTRIICYGRVCSDATCFIRCPNGRVKDFWGCDLCQCSTTAQRDGDVRLVGGATTEQGRVEFFYNSRWYTICDQFWDSNAAKVVCRQLGFYWFMAVAYKGSASPFGDGSYPIFFATECIGTEHRLENCVKKIYTMGSSCQYGHAAAVTCDGRLPERATTKATTTDSMQEKDAAFREPPRISIVPYAVVIERDKPTSTVRITCQPLAQTSVWFRLLQVSLTTPSGLFIKLGREYRFGQPALYKNGRQEFHVSGVEVSGHLDLNGGALTAVLSPVKCEDGGLFLCEAAYGMVWERQKKTQLQASSSLSIDVLPEAIIRNGKQFANKHYVMTCEVVSTVKITWQWQQQKPKSKTWFATGTSMDKRNDARGHCRTLWTSSLTKTLMSANQGTCFRCSAQFTRPDNQAKSFVVLQGVFRTGTITRNMSLKASRSKAKASILNLSETVLSGITTWVYVSLATMFVISTVLMFYPHVKARITGRRVPPPVVHPPPASTGPDSEPSRPTPSPQHHADQAAAQPQRDGTPSASGVKVDSPSNYEMGCMASTSLTMSEPGFQARGGATPESIHASPETTAGSFKEREASPIRVKSVEESRVFFLRRVVLVIELAF